MAQQVQQIQPQQQYRHKQAVRCPNKKEHKLKTPPNLNKNIMVKLYNKVLPVLQTKYPEINIRYYVVPSNKKKKHFGLLIKGGCYCCNGWVFVQRTRINDMWKNNVFDGDFEFICKKCYTKEAESVRQYKDKQIRLSKKVCKLYCVLIPLLFLLLYLHGFELFTYCITDVVLIPYFITDIGW